MPLDLIAFLIALLRIWSLNSVDFNCGAGHARDAPAEEF
jgi:hypothetical protein